MLTHTDRGRDRDYDRATGPSAVGAVIDVDVPTPGVPTRTRWRRRPRSSRKRTTLDRITISCSSEIGENPFETSWAVGKRERISRHSARAAALTSSSRGSMSRLSRWRSSSRRLVVGVILNRTLASECGTPRRRLSTPRETRRGKDPTDPAGKRIGAVIVPVLIHAARKKCAFVNKISRRISNNALRAAGHTAGINNARRAGGTSTPRFALGATRGSVARGLRVCRFGVGASRSNCRVARIAARPSSMAPFDGSR